MILGDAINSTKQLLLFQLDTTMNLMRIGDVKKFNSGMQSVK